MAISCVAAWAEPADSDIQALIPFFAAPIPTRWPPRAKPTSPYLVDILQASGEPTILLSSEADRAALLVGTSRTNFGTPLPLPVEAYRLHLAKGLRDELWVGGVSGGAVTWASTPVSYGYLAKVDREGHFFWKREFGDHQTARSIESLVNLPSGDLIVSGRDSERTWLARISDDGNLVWEKYIGLGKGSAVTRVNGTITLAGIEASGSKAVYREDVALWSFSESGELIGHQTAREDINRVSGEYAADIRIEKASDGVYVFSAWMARGKPKPLEVAKVDRSGSVVWRKQIAETVAELNGTPVYDFPAVTVLSSGDPVVVDAIDKPTKFFAARLDAATGNETLVQAELLNSPPTACQSRWAPIRLLKQDSRTRLWVFGSPWGGADATACGWIGEIALPD